MCMKSITSLALYPKSYDYVYIIYNHTQIKFPTMHENLSNLFIVFGVIYSILLNEKLS